VLGPELLHAQASHDLDPLHVLIDVSELGITGYQAADWLRESDRIDTGISDHRHIEATLSIADSAETGGRLTSALRSLQREAGKLASPPKVSLPPLSALLPEQVMRPRDAFFSASEPVPAADAVGATSAEQLTPYPPGIPALLPGERITAEVIDYLRTGIGAGMVIPDAADPQLHTVRVVRGGPR
jgi:lysine decarboxylase